MEIPAVQQQPQRPELEAVLRQVAHAYGQTVEDLVRPTRRPSEARQVGDLCSSPGGRGRPQDGRAAL